MNRLKRFFCLFLSLVFLSLFLAGCFPMGIPSCQCNLPFPSSSGSSSPWENRRTIPFSEMEYTRPDMDQLSSDLQAAISAIPNIKNADSLIQSVQTMEAALSHMQTMETLASIHSSLNLQDAHWAKEKEFFDQTLPSVADIYVQYHVALRKSPFFPSLEEAFGESFFYDESDDRYTEETNALYQKESAYIRTYYEQYASLTVSWKGKEYSLSQLANQSGSDAANAIKAWYEKNNPVLAAIYLNLVQTRQQIARSLGYDNYLDFIFETEKTEYSLADVQNLIQNVQKELAPILAQLQETGAYYHPNVSFRETKFLQFLKSSLAEFDSSFAEAFSFMETYHLYDFSVSSTKEHGSYTTYLQDYDAPFLFSSYEGDLQSISSILHEFGHFYDYYVASNIPESIDTAEIFSQALPLLLSHNFESITDEKTAYEMQYDILSETVQTILSQSYYTAIELAVYSENPQTLTVQQINNLCQTLASKFGLFSESDSYGWVYSLCWVDVLHFYSSPLYMISYVTSADVALQIWEISVSSPETAKNIYQTLIRREKSPDFLENIVAAGLETPFQENRMKENARIAKMYLIDEVLQKHSLSVAA